MSNYMFMAKDLWLLDSRIGFRSNNGGRLRGHRLFSNYITTISRFSNSSSMFYFVPPVDQAAAVHVFVMQDLPRTLLPNPSFVRQVVAPHSWGSYYSCSIVNYYPLSNFYCFYCLISIVTIVYYLLYIVFCLLFFV